MRKNAIIIFCLLLSIFLTACAVGNTGPHEHNFVTRKNIPASCTAEGEKLYVCECGEQYIETSPQLEHTFGEWKTVVMPTMTVPGKASRVCSVCKTKEDMELSVLTVEEYIAAYAQILISLPTFHTPEELSAEAVLNWALLNVNVTSSTLDKETQKLFNVYSMIEINRMVKHYFGKTFDFESIYLVSDGFLYNEYDEALTWITTSMGGWPIFEADTVTKIDDTHYTLRYAGTDPGETQPPFYGTLTLELKEDRFVILSHSKE